jgi:recombination protein RecA
MTALNELAKLLEKSGYISDKQTTPTDFLSTGYAPLNFRLTGNPKNGLPLGRIVEISGLESSGKTALATHLMINAQKQNGFAMFFDHEMSFEENLAIESGLSVDPSVWIYREGKTFESSLKEAVEIGSFVRKTRAIAKEAPIICVFDSLPYMLPRSKAEKNFDEMNMNDTTALARATSSALPALAPHLRNLNMIAIFINQIRQKPGVIYGPSDYTTGGNAMRYAATVRLFLKSKQIFDEKTKELIKNIVTATIVKNKLNKPGFKVEWDFTFDETGKAKFDSLSSTLDYCLANKLIEASGMWITWEGNKFQGKQKLLDELRKDKEISLGKLDALIEVKASLIEDDMDEELTKPTEATLTD